MSSIFYDLMISWLTKEGLHSTKSLIKWIDEENSSLEVKIKRIYLDESKFWFYDKGYGKIINKNKSFFSISGIQQYQNGSLFIEQPIIIQQEIGFLGIICKQINGVLHFLMQAKIEPGNINKVQLSPTIQATKSNFMQKHGGEKPAFLEYFIKATPHQTLVDQLQSEQSSRFLKKRNRNVILIVDAPIIEPLTHRWMTLGQIKQFMRQDNIVNMDTRTVLSCIPFSLMDTDNNELKEIENKCKDITLLRSLTGVANQHILTEIFHTFNNHKMFSDIETMLTDLYSLKHWHMEDKAFVCDKPFPFHVIFCDICIQGREVSNWTQPLFEATGISTFGLIYCVEDGIKKFLVNAKSEIGCFDGVELGATIQDEGIDERGKDEISILFYKKLFAKEGIAVDILLSEEGGRFYHEQNRNVIIEIQKSEISLDLPHGYFWCDYKTLNTLVQINNCLNIQLRNLLSLLEV
ncbi:NDP-hexose 2,3-dehydratase family protein [Clostridium tagluense]|uniref:DNDP-4-keto-6-deoxy-glucose-2,3-dehydratase n=1 Tax=Clostridium tagluense TaxID=360422 RepID=A0A401UGT8_9CLOT|nr:NDP-hexose 2,3-dehydratase family protein [Clostridium tagluense]GCD08714.1 dNDP-4-keto-6-deoxy-glucose-2,3- dehydratase [Clostridium tagluense]